MDNNTVSEQNPAPALTPKALNPLEILLGRLKEAKRLEKRKKTRGAFGKHCHNGVRGWKNRPERKAAEMIVPPTTMTELPQSPEKFNQTPNIDVSK